MRNPMRGKSLERTFAVSTAILVVVLVSAIMMVVEIQSKASLRRMLEERGTSIARSIGAVATPSLLAYNYPALQIAAEGAAGNPGVVYVAIHDKEGVLAGVAGAHRDEDRSTIVRITEDAPRIHDVHLSDRESGRKSALEVAVAVHVEGVPEPWGAVRVGLSYDAVDAELRHLRLQVFGIGLLLSAIAVLCARWLARRFTAPLRQLAQGTEALARGDLTHRIPIQGAKELADLGHSFNMMIDRLQEKARESREFQAALENLNATLEQQVLDRTRALEESTAQYKSLVDNSPDSILMVQHAQVRFVNKAFLETFGLSETEVAGSRFDLTRIFDPSSAALAGGRIAAWERGEPARPAEVLGRDAAGNLRHLELRGSRIEFQGQPACECLLVDMTEAKRLRGRLAETEKLRALGELAGGVAHDFNNLLGAILGRIQLLRRRKFDRDIDLEMAVIEKAAQDGRETVRRIQEFSRTRRDKKFDAVDLAELLRDAVEITRTRWRDDASLRKVSIDLRLETTPVPPILGNASELREVFTNIIINAVDAMPQGGALRVACGQDGERVWTRFTDTGVGMTEAIRAQLFDPFFTTKGNRGMGLGMSVAYGIVTRHDGKIDVETSLGKGTSFTLDFPVSKTAMRSTGGDGASMPELVQPGRILVIDDEPEVAEVVRDVLLSAGHTVDMENSGESGVQRARVASYDLVLTDLGMPDMSGWEVAERIGQIRPGLPVALVTGWGSSLDADEAHRKGVAAVIHKPFDIDELVRTAAGILAKRA